MDNMLDRNENSFDEVNEPVVFEGILSDSWDDSVDTYGMAINGLVDDVLKKQELMEAQEAFEAFKECCEPGGYFEGELFAYEILEVNGDFLKVKLFNAITGEFMAEVTRDVQTMFEMFAGKKYDFGTLN